MRCTTGACPPTGWFLAIVLALLVGVRGRAQPVGRGEREQLLAGGADLDLGVHRRADAAVEARGPAAVVLLELGRRVLPVLPQPVLVEAGVEVIPREDLQLVALADGVPVEIDAEARQLGRGGLDPAPVGEVL